MKEKFIVRDKAFYIAFFTLMIPIALQNLIGLGGSLADNIMVGRYSETALAGVAIVNRLQFFLLSVVGGLSGGIVVICSQYWGRKQVDRIKEIVAIGMRIAVVFSVVITTLSIVFAQQYLRIFTDDPAVIQDGITYLRIAGFGYLFVIPTQIMLSGLRSVENVLTGIVISVFALCVDLFFNYTLIFGKLGFPEMGAAGAAVSTVLGQVLEFTLLAIYIFTVDKQLDYKLKDLFYYRREDLKQYFRVATPLILSGGTWGIAMAIQTFILSSFGTVAVAADSISGNVFSFLTVLVYGASSGANVLIGKTVGENRQDVLKPYVRTLQVLFIGLGLITGTAIFLSRDWFISIYTVSIAPESVALARQFLTVFSVTSIGTAYQMSCLTGIVRGGGDTRFVFVNDMIHMWLVVLPIAAIATFVFKAPPLAVFIVLKSDQILKCIVAFFKVNSFNWVKQVDA